MLKGPQSFCDNTANGTGDMPPYSEEFVAIMCVLSSSKCTETVFGRGSAPDPVGKAYNAPITP